MKAFGYFLIGIEDTKQRTRTKEVLKWVINEFPDLVTVIKYDQPMFTDHNTFIIGFSLAKNHLSIAPEKKAINHFSKEIIKSGYEYTTNLIKIPWTKAVDCSLLEKIIEYNISDKKDCSSFWRKEDY